MEEELTQVVYLTDLLVLLAILRIILITFKGLTLDVTGLFLIELLRTLGFG